MAIIHDKAFIDVITKMVATLSGPQEISLKAAQASN